MYIFRELIHNTKKHTYTYMNGDNDIKEMMKNKTGEFLIRNLFLLNCNNLIIKNIKRKNPIIP